MKKDRHTLNKYSRTGLTELPIALNSARLAGFCAVLALSWCSVESRAESDEKVSVLVRVENGADTAALAAQVGAQVHYAYQLLPGLVNLRDVPVTALDELATMSGVIDVELDRRVTIALNDSTPLIRGLQGQISAAGLTATGAGVRVCVCDTGINATHAMYAGQIDAAAGFDFVNNDADPADDNGHGSHVAGIAVGRTGINVDFLGGSGLEPLQGIAPEATLIGVKVLGADGSGNLSDVIAGIEHCASPGLPGGAAHVINLSLSDVGGFTGTCDSDTLAMAANAAVASGVVVVASAGNTAFADALPAPACASQVIAVGSTYDDPFPNPDFPPFDSFTFCTKRNAFGFCLEECTDAFPVADQVACYSNHSNNLDVTAPGSYIWSAVEDSPSLISGRHGTSQAAPHVAGLAALVLGVDPTLTPGEVRQLIRDGAIDYGPPGFDPAYGYGRIDVINTLSLVSGCVIDNDCDDGLFCNGAETCLDGDCLPAQDPCVPQLCREADDTCVDCLTPADCDDGDPCNGIELCDPAGLCQLGPIDDCNGNGTLDSCDIAAGTSSDCNSNAIPDECEADCNSNSNPDDCDLAAGTSLDCNANTVPDECDIAGGASEDCNANAVPDECELDCNSNGVPDDCDILGGAAEDCNTNGIPDECDIAAGTSEDCNGNAIPDECEPDCNGNQIPDDCDLAGGTSADCNDNGAPDECDVAGGISEDCNGNTVPDECETDCNGNGIPDDCDLAEGTSSDCNLNMTPDECDIASGTSQDCNANALPDECEPDCNGNQIPDDCDLAGGTSADCNNNDTPDECDVAGGISEDCNGNTVPDECEFDCNGNGSPDDCDIAGGTSPDCNVNTIPDECDVASGTSEDCNANTVPDECETDCNANGIPDDCDLLGGTSQDCNLNAVPDECDVASGTSEDCNANVVPDECEADCNANGSPDDCDLDGGGSRDCNENEVPDECDVDGGASQDCNSNTIPDECEGDCNANGIPDDCDVNDGSSPDCNGNINPDECDIASGTSEDCNENLIPDECEPDCDGNLIPDECELPAVVPLGSRYVSITPRPRCWTTPVAFFVTAPEWFCPGKWVDVDGFLTTSPVFLLPGDWQEVRVADYEIIPDQLYSIAVVTEAGSSPPVTVRTWRHGDVNGDGLSDFDDVLLLVLGFQGVFDDATLENLDLEPCQPNRTVNFGDVLAAVNAFQGGTYADTGCPMPCP